MGTSGELAIALTGGGARGAYQVGVLRALGRLFPDMRFPLITGVSAGAINAVFLAAHPGPLERSTRDLADLWFDLDIDDVVVSNLRSLTGNLMRWTQRLGFGGEIGPPARALLDTSPLRALLARTLCGDQNAAHGEGRIEGIDHNLRAGHLKALALTTVDYGTGRTVHWVDGSDIQPWSAANRVARRVSMRLDHVMASSALPLLFPAVRLADGWYGDGGIRMAAPLSPSLHLGARRVLAVSTRYGRSAAEAADPVSVEYPSPARIGGHLMNAIFLDVLDQDADRLERLNDLIRKLDPADRGGLEPIELLLLRPSEDLGRLASDFEPRLPRGFRYFTRRLGTEEGKSPDFLSLLMFQPDYLRRLISIGERDTEERADDLRALFDQEPS